MASKTVMDAVKALLPSIWTGTPVYWPNDPNGQPPLDGSEFLAVQFPVAEEHGTPSPLETGGVRFVYSVPAGAGTDPYMQKIDAFRDALRGRFFLGVLFQAPSPPTMLDGEDDHGSYFLISFAIPYRHFVGA
ncbi:hypothetical protein ACUSIJ_24990 [Pseudochelatococcus sp. B33]